MTYFEIYTRVRFLNETMLSAGRDSRNAKFFRLISWHVFQLFSFLPFLSDGGSRRRKKLPELCDVFAGWGDFFCASWADVSATSSVSQIALLLPAVESEAYTLTFRLHGCFQSRLRIWFYKCFSKITPWPLPATQTCRAHCTVGAGSIVRERMEGRGLSPVKIIHTSTYIILDYIWFNVILR